jgi:hypothetical protein
LSFGVALGLDGVTDLGVDAEGSTMRTPIAVNRSCWWGVIEYEVSMFRGLPELGGLGIVSPNNPNRSGWLVVNSIVEGRVLHTRNLCDFCTSKDVRDIRPSDLFDNYDTDSKYNTLKGLLQRLDQQYGRSKDETRARWAFNTKLAHPTKKRREGFDYGPLLNGVVPIIEEIIAELEILRGRPFPELPT